MLWNRIGSFQCGSGYSLSRRGFGSGETTNADPDPSQTLKSKKLNFDMNNILKVGSRSKNIPT